MKNHGLLPIACIILAILLAGCSGMQSILPATRVVTIPTATIPPDGLKLFAIFPGVVTDADYNSLGYLGINEVQRELGIKTTYEEQVTASMADKVIREYIADGYNIIWAHGGEYVDNTMDLARHFPSVIFIAEGDEPVLNLLPNIWFIDRNYQVGFYLIGATAALSTRTGKIGYLGGERLPFTYAEVHAIKQAIKDLNLEEQVELKTVWVGDFNDELKAGELVDDLLADDVDFIMGSLNLGMYGAFKAVNNASGQYVLITDKYMDKSNFVPDHYVTSLLYDFSTPLKDIVKGIMSGKNGGYYALDFAAGTSLQFPFTNVNPSIEQQVKELMDKIIDGSIQIEKDTSPIL